MRLRDDRIRVLSALAVLITAACGGTSSNDERSGDGGSVDGGDAASLADARPNDAATSCVDLSAQMRSAIVKECSDANECAVTTLYDCCVVYVGIRAYRRVAFESLRDDYTRACPDNRGCACADHTETGEDAPPQTPPVTVVATCEANKCTARVQ